MLAQDPQSRSYGTMIKLTEKFARDPDKLARDDIAKRTFFLKDDKIRVTFHLEPDRIVPGYQEFRKPSSEQKANLSDLISYYEVNPFAKNPKKQHLYANMLTHFKAEQSCISSAKSSEREIQEIIKVSVRIRWGSLAQLCRTVTMKRETFPLSFLFMTLSETIRLR